MSATRILWGQIACVLTIVLITTWAATQWTAWRLGYQPQLGHPWFELAPGIPIYLPPAFFWWWYAYDAYAPGVFVEGACVAASGGIISIIVAFALLLELVIHSVGIRSIAGQCGFATIRRLPSIRRLRCLRWRRPRHYQTCRR